MTPANITSAVVTQPLLSVRSQNKDIISSDKHYRGARTLVRKNAQSDLRTLWRARRS